MLRLADEFCGGGGSMTGWTAVPYVQGVWAAIHDQVAIETHAATFPDVTHYRGDIEDAELVAGSCKKKVSLLGRAVPPPVAEVLGAAALVEAIAGHDLPEPAAT